MTQRFYKPILHTTLGKPCIIYPARDESLLDSVLLRTEKSCIERFVDEVATANAVILKKGDYIFAIPWNVGKQLYLDIWIFELKNKSESGPLVTIFTFKGTEWAKDMGTASGDGLIVVGYEEILRRRHKTLQDYLADQNRHEILPPENRADEEFYT